MQKQRLAERKRKVAAVAAAKVQRKIAEARAAQEAAKEQKRVANREEVREL